MIFHEDYIKILQTASVSDIEQNNRTEENVKVIEYPVNMVLDLRNRIVPTVGVRKHIQKVPLQKLLGFFKVHKILLLYRSMLLSGISS